MRGSRSLQPRRLPLLAAVAVGLAWAGGAFAGCGSEERRFDSEGLAELITKAGVPIEVGEELRSSDASIEVRVIALEPDGGGSMLVADDEGRARNEFARCESASSLVCFRAGNVVLRFDQLSADQRERVGEALKTIESASRSD